MRAPVSPRPSRSGPGASARLQYVVEGGPDGDVQYYWIVVDGQLTENKLGELADAEVTLTESYEDAKRMQQGELDTERRLHAGQGQGVRRHRQTDDAAADHVVAGVRRVL